MIAEHVTGPITAAVLAGVDILLVPTRNTVDPILPFSAAEVATLQSFVLSGKGLWVLDDNGNSSGVNTLATAFGITFRGDYIQDPSDNEGLMIWPTIHLLEPHAITAGVASYGYYLGCCLWVDPPAEVIARADEDAYSQRCPVGSMPPVLAAYEAGGRAVFAGDITPLHPNYYPSLLRPEEQLLLQNIVNWLMPPPTATTPVTWGRLKSIYSNAPPD